MPRRASATSPSSARAWSTAAAPSSAPGRTDRRAIRASKSKQSSEPGRSRCDMADINAGISYAGDDDVATRRPRLHQADAFSLVMGLLFMALGGFYLVHDL